MAYISMEKAFHDPKMNRILSELAEPGFVEKCQPSREMLYSTNLEVLENMAHVRWRSEPPRS